MDELKLPKSFKLFGTTIDIIFDNTRMNDLGYYGLFESGKHKITLSTIDGLNDLGKDRIINTFYHESVHAILDSMNEIELNKNEKFVDVFAKLIRQMNETKEY